MIVLQEALFDSAEYSVVPDDWRSDDWEAPVQDAGYAASKWLKDSVGAGGQ